MRCNLYLVCNDKHDLCMCLRFYVHISYIPVMYVLNRAMILFNIFTFDRCLYIGF